MVPRNNSSINATGYTTRGAVCVQLAATKNVCKNEQRTNRVMFFYQTECFRTWSYYLDSQYSSPTRTLIPFSILL